MHSNLFKLFSSDVGLLTSYYGSKIQQTILLKEEYFNFGSIIENFAAQQLKYNGFDLYYYSSKKHGEVDSLIDIDNEAIPIEIKSGKNYKRHNALSNLLSIKEYNINKAYVFYNNNNIQVSNSITYFPIYLLTFLKKEEELKDNFYEVNIDLFKSK